MSSLGYNKVREAKLRYEQVLLDELVAAGWYVRWRKQNNFTYYTKDIPGVGCVTATSLEDALKWEYEL
jgi:hypothetical protein